MWCRYCVSIPLILPLPSFFSGAPMFSFATRSLFLHPIPSVTRLVSDNPQQCRCVTSLSTSTTRCHNNNNDDNDDISLWEFVILMLLKDFQAYN